MSKIDEYRRFHQGKNTRYVLTCNFYLALKDNQLNVLIYCKKLYVFSLFSYSLYIYIYRYKSGEPIRLMLRIECSLLIGL